jgi:hypothetical protein
VIRALQELELYLLYWIVCFSKRSVKKNRKLFVTNLGRKSVETCPIFPRKENKLSVMEFVSKQSA